MGSRGGGGGDKATRWLAALFQGMIGACGGGGCDALGEADLECRAGRRFGGAEEDPAAGEGDHREAAL